MTCILKKGKYHDLNFTGTTQNQSLTILIFFLNESEIVNSLNLRMNSETVNILPKKLKLKTSTVPIDKK